MAQIEKRVNSSGEMTYRTKIRKKGVEISRTFYEEEDAILFGKYKERLIDNMSNFEIPIENRTTLFQVMELKFNTIEPTKKKEISDFKCSIERITGFFIDKKFYNEITYQDWVECAKYFLEMEVFRGAKTESAKRKMSPVTLKKIFAHVSASISYCNFIGIPLDNLPLKVIQVFINPLIDKMKTDLEVVEKYDS